MSTSDELVTLNLTSGQTRDTESLDLRHDGEENKEGSGEELHGVERIEKGTSLKPRERTWYWQECKLKHVWKRE